MTYRAIGGRRHRSAAWQWSLIGFYTRLVLRRDRDARCSARRYVAPIPLAH